MPEVNLRSQNGYSFEGEQFGQHIFMIKDRLKALLSPLLTQMPFGLFQKSRTKID